MFENNKLRIRLNDSSLITLFNFTSLNLNFYFSFLVKSSNPSFSSNLLKESVDSVVSAELRVVLYLSQLNVIHQQIVNSSGSKERIQTTDLQMIVLESHQVATPLAVLRTHDSIRADLNLALGDHFVSHAKIFTRVIVILLGAD